MVHVVYYDGTNGDLKYATCAGSCTYVMDWTTAIVDATGGAGCDRAGSVHLPGRDRGGPQVHRLTKL
jgi:hypothetical protein